MKLLGQVLELGDGKAELLRHADRPWASATFTGTRHMIALAFEGRDAIEAAELLIARLPDHEFDLPGQIVADAAVAEVTHVIEPTPRLTIELELLLLDDI
ncbi:MAG: hypothetical protein FP826_03080 [Sphingomonadales bacterium]|nr:hypothetical protein [Sphingomonadales bacterium]MBU3991317.1 hypothetical protein [Alphaproteobacteria bacterium]